jgi:hypothetical protein
MHFGCGTLQGVPFDFPKLTENTSAQLGSNAFECLQAESCTMFRSQKVPEIYIFCAKSNPLGTLKQIRGVQDLHNLLCAYYAGRKESCLASTTLKITSRMAKRGQDRSSLSRWL